MQGRETWGRLRQSRAARIVGVYAATAWGVFEIIDKSVRTFGWTQAIPQTSLVLLVVGLFIVGFAAWAYAGQEVGERTGWTWPARIQALLANRWFGRVAVAGLGVAMLLWGWRMVRPDVGYAPFTVPELRATSEAPRVAVLPVTSAEAGLDLPRRTLTRLLATDLNDIEDMRTIRSDLVSRRWEEGSVEPKAVARFGRELGVHFVVVATVERSGEGLRAAAEVLEAGRGEAIGHLVVEGREGDLPGLSDRLAMEVYRALLEDDDVASLGSPIRARTSSMHAFKSYLRAERAFRRADFNLAIAEYGRASSADSAFAMALFREGLARRSADPAVGSPLETFDAAMQHADRLLEDDREMLRASGALEWGMLESVPALAEVVERRRDDPQAWYLLADAEAFVGQALLLTTDSVESTLARAVAADPGFAPAHLLRVSMALLRGAEKPVVEALVDSIAAADAHPSIVAEQRLLVDLAFGEPNRISGLGDVPLLRLWRLATALAVPRFADRQAVVLQEIRRRAGRSDPREAKRALFYNLLARGLQPEAIAILDDPGMVGFWPEAVYRATQRGMGLPADMVLEATDVYDQYAAGTTWFYGGAMAVDQGRWDDVSFAVDRLFEEADMIDEEGDGIGSRERAIAAGLLDQYARVRSGLTPERVVELETRRLAGTGSSEWAWMVDGTARWWLGELWLELGDRDQAARYFRSLWRDPMAGERLREIEARGPGESPARSARR